DGEAAGDLSGGAVAMSASGTRIAIGAWSNQSLTGQVRVYEVLTSPTAPTISSVTSANGSLTVVFTPGTDGGSAITNYKYSVDGTNYVALNPVTTASPFTISGLTNGTAYSVTIKAMNAIGDSPASNAIAASPTAPTTSTVAPTATPTTTTTTPTTSTVAPTTTTPTTTTTINPTTTTTVVKKISAPVVSISKPISTKSIATYLNLAVSSTSQLSVRVASVSAKYCTVSGTKLKALKAGSCTVTVKVTPKKGKPVSKTVTLKTIK
ncbi:MAG: fibronectin type III domain-containing protein, partial [Actinomycetota bacterium]